MWNDQARPPKQKAGFAPQGDAEFKGKLTELGGVRPGKRSVMRGGEGEVTRVAADPNLALKRWFSSRLEDMPKSVESLDNEQRGSN